ncbi:MAG: cobyric acid synthase [Firmicutes bacterium]|nr:cobyric acid synthase [Bacillota bacterium]
MAVNIMIQGTMSNAGKSLITAGLCRVFAQDGYIAAPFKSQNMSLNSFITDDGLEMGRAQAVQAEACGKKPSVFMNPILLKPTTDIGSQIIVNGVARENMSAVDYFKFKKTLIPEILAAYDALAAENDIIVIEGAGSPAEINLKADDIVNMGLAEMVDAPVLLVGDIDRGGVFAQLAGTVMLLEKSEQARIKGVIINKFRGDIEILKPGLKMLEDICGKPVLGVVPYADIDIDDEDSLTERFNGYKSLERKAGSINIKVIRLPRISNFSDITALEAADGVYVSYAEQPSELRAADIIIIPGTKSTAADMQWMRNTGFAAEVLKAAKAGTIVIGICGGYQMLGEKIVDASGVEGVRSEIAGLGVLPVITEFAQDKRTEQANGKICRLSGIFADLSGIEISGYEIHMGRTFRKNSENNTASGFSALNRDGNINTDGCVFGNIIGTYLHGLFDNKEFSERLLYAAAKLKGIEFGSFAVPDMKEYKQRQYDKLADIIRSSVNIDEIYRIMGMK